MTSRLPAPRPRPVPQPRPDDLELKISDLLVALGNLLDNPFSTGFSAPPLRTETLCFEFAAAATQHYTCQHPGYVVAFTGSLTVFGISLGSTMPTQLPNGGLTRILAGAVYLDGSGSQNQWRTLRQKFNVNDILSVNVTAPGVINVVLGYPDVN